MSRRTRYVVENRGYKQRWFPMLDDAIAYANRCQELMPYPESLFLVTYRRRVVYSAPWKTRYEVPA